MPPSMRRRAQVGAPASDRYGQGERDLSGPPEYGSDRRPFWNTPFREYTAIQWLHLYETFTATAHGAQAVTVAVLLSHRAGKMVPVHIPYVTWPAHGANATEKHFGYESYPDGQIDLGLCVVSFFLLSWLFQTVAVMPGFWDRFTHLLLDCYVQPFRWIEYSVSASLMAVIFALLNGITETTFLYNIFVSFFTVMVLGLLQEMGMSVYKRRQQEQAEVRTTLEYVRGKVREVRSYVTSLRAPDGSRLVPLESFVAHGRDADGARRALLLQDLFGDVELFTEVQAALVSSAPAHALTVFLPHLLGWVPFVAVVSVFLVTFTLAVSRGPSQPPDWVYFLYSFQFVIMSSFAVVQGVEQVALYRERSPERCRRYAVRAEFAYTTLSLAAKSLLAWVLYTNMLVEQSIAY
jgi:hypothetical protein